MSAEDCEDWCRGICKDAISASLTAAERAIADTAKAAVTGYEPPSHGVVPIRRGKGAHARPEEVTP